MNSGLGRRPRRSLGFAMIAVVTLGLWPGAVAAANGPSFTRQPVGGLAGQLLPVQPEVSIMKGNGVDIGAAGSITLSLKPGTGAVGAQLTCGGSGPGGRMFDVKSGAATASGCIVDLAGNGYVMTAVYSAGGAEDSALFSISGGTPTTKLAFTTQPGGGAPGTVWAIQPVVTIQDVNGATVSTSTATVTLAITSGTGAAGATLSCGNTLSKGAVNGVAVFSGCKIDKVGTGYTLTATSNGITPAVTAPFAISSAGAAVRVGFATQPTRGTPGGALATQPVVSIQDANGATVTSSQAVVTLSIASNPGGATLTCTGGLSRAAVNGVAAFNGCALSAVGVGYTLTAASPGLTGATSAQFDVADRLAFVTQPSGAQPGVAFAAQPVVAVLAGSTATAIHDQATQVTLAIKAGTGTPGAALTCTGGLTRAAANGLATFTGCAINAPSPISPPNPYQLVATAANLTSATSNQFAVGAPVASTNITVTPSASTITWGQTVVLTTRFATSGANRTFQLWGARDNRNPANFALITTLTTNASGVASFPYTPPTNLYYEARFAGSADLAAGTSPQARVVVRQIALLRPTNNGAMKTVNRGTTVAFTTTVRPSRPELTPATVTYWVYRKVSGVWQAYFTTNVVASAAGLAPFSWTFSSSGSWYVRSMANPTPYNANSVKSPVEQYNVQ